MTTETLHSETFGDKLANGLTRYDVIRRPSGTVQIWATFPAGQSAGYPEGCFSGTLEEARRAWRLLVQTCKHCS